MIFKNVFCKLTTQENFTKLIWDCVCIVYVVVFYLMANHKNECFLSRLRKKANMHRFSASFNILLVCLTNEVWYKKDNSDGLEINKKEVQQSSFFGTIGYIIEKPKEIPVI